MAGSGWTTLWDLRPTDFRLQKQKNRATRRGLKNASANKRLHKGDLMFRKLIRSKKFWVLCSVSVILLAVIFFAGMQCGKKDTGSSFSSRPVAAQNVPTAATPTPATASATATDTAHRNYVVRKGDFLRKIAQEHGVAWEAILLLNEQFLQAKYEEVCDRMSPRYRQRHGGLFCNDRYNRPYANTLVPGWELKIPVAKAPTAIERAVGNIVGDKVAIVIDDTGSIENDRTIVSEWYMAAVKNSHKQIIGVWLYADGNVRHFTEAGEVVFRTTGGYENTYGALKAAAAENPDSIILVTDEPGDDWRWNEVSNLPAVIGHCLPEEGANWCEANLKKLAEKTNGQYLSGLPTN